jgi:PAS domain S-box-containing protein
MKFSTKLLLLYLGFTLGVIIPVCSFLYYVGQQTAKTQIKQNLQERAEHLMDKIDRLLFERFADIQVLAHDPVFQTPNLSPFELTQRLITYRNAYKMYISLSFFDAHRIRVADTAGLSIGNPVSESRWVQDVFEKGIISVGADIHFDKDLQKNVLFVAAPVRDKNRHLLGAVVGRVPIERIYILDTLTTKDENIHIDLIDKNGLLLYSNQNQPLILNVSMEKNLEEQLSNLFHGHEGEKVFYTIAHEQGFLNFSGNQWTLIVHYPVKEAFAALIDLRRQAIIVGLGLLLFAFIALFWFSRQMIKPIITLKNASLELGRGHLKTRVPVFSSYDEIGKLSIVFNQMADLLDEKTTERQKEQEKFATVLDSLEAFVYVADMQTYELLFANQFAKQTTKSDLIGKICWQHFQKEQTGPCPFCSNHRLVDQNGQPTEVYSWEHQSTLNNHWYYLQDRAIRWTDGRIVRLTIATDITKRKQAEEALQKSEERFDLALQGANDGLWDWNLEINQIYHSPRFKEILGFAEHEFSDTPDEYVTRVHPDDVTQLTTTLSGYLNKEIPSYEHIHRIQHREGHYLWVLARAVAIWNQQDKPIRIVGTIVDITVQKEAEEQLQQTMQQVKKSEQLLKTVINATPDWIFVKDNNYRYLLANQSFAKALATQPEQMVGKNDEEIGFPKEQIFGNPKKGIEGFRVDDQAALSGKTLHNPYDPAKFADGTVHVFDTLKMPLRDESGHIFAMLGFSRDITERTRVEKALLLAKESAEQAKIEAENANKAKSTFLANMSHELRTPLNGILGYTQILERDKTLDEKQQEGIGIIQRSGEYLLTLINDILDLSKIEAGKIEIYATDFNFNVFIQGITELFQMRSQQKGIAFNYEPLSHLPLGIRTDEKRLRQILINLLGNAIKFTEKGGVDLKIGYDNEKIRFQIEDTGIGIASYEIDKIFLPFQQVGDPDYQAEGTGLGLSITKKLVEMMGGELHVESQLGHGSTFWFALNLPDISELIKVKKTEQPVVIGFEGAPHKILVVDDKWENRLVLVNLLKPLGFEMVEANNGQEYLEKAKQNCPDLILTDLVMPVMDGFEATRQLRKLSACHEVKVIAVSASVFDSDQKESLEAGCDDFINKPIHVEELLEKLKIHLGLIWIYERDASGNLNHHSTTEESTENLASEEEMEFVGPSPEQAAVLFDLAMMGDIAEIVAEIEKLEKSEQKLQPFCRKIRELAKAFDEEQICELVGQYK